MARRGKKVLAIVLSMALLISTLTGALVGLVGSADSASGEATAYPEEGIINIPLYDDSYTYTGASAQEGSGETELSSLHPMSRIPILHIGKLSSR